MASIKKRGENQWRALIRRRGFAPQSGTFRTQKEADAWARGIESTMDRGAFVSSAEAEKTTLREALERYRKEITPGKRSVWRSYLNIPKMGCIVLNMGIIGEIMMDRAQAHSSVANALFSKTQQRVLAVLFGNPTRSFYANEVITLAGSGTGSVQRELARLDAAGLVAVTRIGNQKHYQANVSAPIFEELHGLILKTSGLADILRAALAPLADRIDTAFIYGSLAKGEDTAKSDVDLMVISDSLSYPDLYAALEEATTRIGRTVNPSLYKPQDFNKRVKEGNAFMRRVLAQPKIWLIGEKREPAP